MSYRHWRPLLFRLDPESTHSWALGLLRIVGAVPPLRAAVRRSFATQTGSAVEVFGLRFSNAVGLAAGYDKDGLAWRGLACLGFGHLELGTVTPHSQPGNPRPRIFRLVEDRSLINRLGFPSRGAEFLARRLTGRTGGPIIGVNLGKQKETPLDRAAEDYGLLLDRFAPLADYLAINVSSPNTPDLRRLQDRRWLEPLLHELRRRRDAQQVVLRRTIPLLVKLSPDLSERELDEALAAIESAGIDGVIATNTTLLRADLRAVRAMEPGGLSGAALCAASTEIVRRVHRQTGGRLPIVACGGVASIETAQAKLDAGAALVQIYTGLIYEGPGLVTRLARELSVPRATKGRVLSSDR